MSKNRAVPLCLPNNYKWDEKSGVYSKDEDQSRTSLCVIDTALRKLRQIKGNEQDKLALNLSLIKGSLYGCNLAFNELN